MQSDACAKLADHLRQGIDAKNLDVDELAERTKVPRATIQSLLDEPTSSLLPERVYLRGHLSVLATDLCLDREQTLALFDDAYPAAPTTQDLIAQNPRFGTGSMAVAAGLACAAILAVVLAFVTAFD